MRKNATQEYIFGLYFTEAYGKSLYETLLAMKKNPNDPFLQQMLRDNMVKLRDARNNYTTNKYLETENPKFTDSYNRFLFFMGNLRKNDLTQIIDNYQK
ncbi:hypothetical protein [Flavobacterium sp. 3HN19-14]|uniref:hypothetical protein n=1 Tax=Flavobacterium sp. 3HN19-14 TaxID=3448133 RepID=UPI003EDFD7C8